MATDGETQISSILDFVELPDTGSSTVLLKPMLSELHDVARCRVFDASNDSALQNMLRQTLLSRSKVVFISTLSPCKKDAAETRTSLDTAVDLSLQTSGAVVQTYAETPASHSNLRSAMGTPAASTPLRSVPSSATGVRTSRPSDTSDASVTLAESSVPFEKRVGHLPSASEERTAAKSNPSVVKPTPAVQKKPPVTASSTASGNVQKKPAFCHTPKVMPKTKQQQSGVSRPVQQSSHHQSR